MNDENLVIGQCPECREINRHAERCKNHPMNRIRASASEHHEKGKKTIIFAGNRPEDKAGIPDDVAHKLGIRQSSPIELKGWPAIPHVAAQSPPEVQQALTNAMLARNKPLLLKPSPDAAMNLLNLANIFVECLNGPHESLHAAASLLDEYALTYPDKSWQRFAYAEMASTIKMVMHRRGGT